MKKLLILLLSIQTAYAQTGTVFGWNYIVSLPPGYETTTLNYPTLVFFPGRGEVGTNVEALRNNGPHAYIAQGGIIPGFIVISLQPQFEFPTEGAMDLRLRSLKQLYRIDTNRVNLTGLSHGGWCAATYVAIYPTEAFSSITVQGMIPDDNTPYPQVYQNWFGKHICFEQSQDGRGGQQLVNYLNSIHPGQATYIETNYSGGGHCCFNNYYGGQGVQPLAFMLNGKMQTIYQYLADINKYTTVSLPPDVRTTRKKIVQFRQIENTIYFKASDFAQYYIFNITGQLIQMGNYKSGVNEIKVKPVAKGIYIFRSTYNTFKIKL